MRRSRQSRIRPYWNSREFLLGTETGSRNGGNSRFPDELRNSLAGWRLFAKRSIYWKKEDRAKRQGVRIPDPGNPQRMSRSLAFLELLPNNIGRKNIHPSQTYKSFYGMYLRFSHLAKRARPLVSDPSPRLYMMDSLRKPARYGSAGPAEDLSSRSFGSKPEKNPHDTLLRNCWYDRRIRLHHTLCKKH